MLTNARSFKSQLPPRPSQARCSLHAKQQHNVKRITVAASSTVTDQRVTIVGGGIAGLSCAVALHKVGIPSIVLEQADHLRTEGSAIGVWTNGWHALDALGVGDHLRQDHLPLTRIELCSSSGQVLRGFKISECDGVHEFRGVQRGRLLAALAAALPKDTIRSGTKVTGVSIDEATGRSSLQMADGSRLDCDLLVGTDGAQSATAAALQLPPANYAGYVAYRGVAEVERELPLPADTCRQVFGRGTRVGMYPLTRTTCYWYICFNAAEGATAPSTPALRKADALERVVGWGTGIQKCIEATPAEQIAFNRVTDRWTKGDYGRGNVTLAGDAAHPMTPNLGQGGCVALEDGVVLAQRLAAAGGLAAPAPVLQQALRQYERDRAARALTLTVRANIMGQLLQLPQELICTVRNVVVSKLFTPSHFLDHAMFNCGPLPSK